MDKQHVTVIFGGPSPEYEVSIISARYIVKTLTSAGFDVLPLGWLPDRSFVKNDVWQTMETYSSESPTIGQPFPLELLRQQQSIVFPVIHGAGGEDGEIFGFLRTMGLPAVGCDFAVFALAMNKIWLKSIWRENGIPVLEDIAFSFKDDVLEIADEAVRLWSGPWFVKPAGLGSSLGISKAINKQQLISAIQLAQKLDEWGLIEPALDKPREIECAVLVDQKGSLASPLGEIRPGADFYDYSDKYESDQAELIAPAEMKNDQMVYLQSMALKAFSLVAGYGLARVDGFLDSEGNYYLNEMNLIPGFTQISMYPKLMDLAGLNGELLMKRLVDMALWSFKEKQQKEAAGVDLWQGMK